MQDVFYWIGIAVSVIVILAIGISVLLFAYVHLIHDRFRWIPFRKTPRRLSIASWHQSKLVSDEHFKADDWVISPRFFYLDYKLGTRRWFIMTGLLDPMRYAQISGKHPEAAA